MCLVTCCARCVRSYAAACWTYAYPYPLCRYVRAAVAAGLDVDAIAPRLSFFFGIGMNLCARARADMRSRVARIGHLRIPYSRARV